MPQFPFKVKIRKKQFIFGAFVGLGLLIGIISFLPDRKLHLIFCDAGQGDATYIRFPNGGDMLIDGGPDKSVLACLGRHMPFYDRKIDVVVATHPQKDHIGGLAEVVKRYKVGHFLTVPVAHSIEEYEYLKKQIEIHPILVHYLTRGDRFRFSEVVLRTIWPDKNWLIDELDISKLQSLTAEQLIGIPTLRDLNLFSLYLHLNFHNFDILLTGDGDREVQLLLANLGLDHEIPEKVEVLKVPHHGSKTGMTEEFIKHVRPKFSVIEVGKNSYGHPAQSVIEKLSQYGKVFRTDKGKDVVIITDGYRTDVRYR